MPYKAATIRIDPTAVDPVWGETDTGARLDVFWAKGFVAGTSADPTIVDPTRQVVARDGEKIVVPEGAWPRLHGHFVCPGPSALYVLLQDPV